MAYKIIKNLSNAAYHDPTGEYGEYVSSSALKRYLISPKYFKYLRENPESSNSESLKLGSLFHSLMEHIALKGSPTEGIRAWADSIAVFQPPSNEKTGQPYGAATKAYKEAYDVFLADASGKTIAKPDDVERCNAMVNSLLYDCGKTSEQVRKLLRWAKDCEISYFHETDDGVKLKVRPDMMTKNKIVDWKTTSLDDLSEDNIAKTIIKYGYHISLAMYQYVLHEIIGIWYAPVLVFVQTQAPFDCAICDICDWCYSMDGTPNVGALEFERLLKLHRQCVNDDSWLGVEVSIPENNQAIMKPDVPAWYGQKIYNQ